MLKMTPVMRSSTELVSDQTAGPGITTQNASNQHVHGTFKTLSLQSFYLGSLKHIVKLMSLENLAHGKLFTGVSNSTNYMQTTAETMRTYDL